MRLIKRRDAGTGTTVRIGDETPDSMTQERAISDNETEPVEALPALVEEESLDRRLQTEFKAGFDEGRRHTERNLRTELAAQLEMERNRIDSFARNIEASLAEFRHALERDGVKLAIAIAERIVKREVQVDSETVLRQIQEAIRRLVGVDKVKIRVHPNDEELVRSMRSSLIAGSDAVRELAIEMDESIAPGGCVLESDSGNVDASISTQLERIESALFGDHEETR